MEPPKRRPGRRWLWSLLALLLAAGAFAAWQAARHRPAAAAPRVLTATVRTGVVRQVLRLSGVTAAQNSATLTAPMLYGSHSRGQQQHSLTLQKTAAAGSWVRQGAVVAEFDTQYMANRLDDYRAWELQHQLNLVRLGAHLEVRRKAYEQQIRVAKARMDKAALDLKTIPIRSAISSEKLRLDYAQAAADYHQLRTRMDHVETSESAALKRSQLDWKQAAVEVRKIERNVRGMVARAPMDGLVVMLSIYRGSQMAEIQAGDEVRPGQGYMQIVDMKSLLVNARVNQVDLESLRLGQRALVRFDAFPGLELPARIIAIGAFARAQGWRGNYVRDVSVRLKLEKTDPRLAPNLTASADVILATSEPSPVIPRACIFRGKAYVRQGETWEERPLRLGLQDHISAAVLEGLRDGDVVAAEPAFERRPEE